MESHPWCCISLWSCPLHRTGTIAPNWIRYEIDSLCLDEKRSMSDIGHFHGFTFMSCIWFYGMNMSLFPERDSLIEYPFPESEEPIFSFFSEKFFFRFSKSKCFPRIPSDVMKFFSIKVIILLSDIPSTC